MHDPRDAARRGVRLRRAFGASDFGTKTGEISGVDEAVRRIEARIEVGKEAGLEARKKVGTESGKEGIEEWGEDEVIEGTPSGVGVSAPLADRARTAAEGVDAVVKHDCGDDDEDSFFADNALTGEGGDWDGIDASPVIAASDSRMLKGDDVNGDEDLSEVGSTRGKGMGGSILGLDVDVVEASGVVLGTVLPDTLAEAVLNRGGGSRRGFDVIESSHAKDVFVDEPSDSHVEPGGIGAASLSQRRGVDGGSVLDDFVSSSSRGGNESQAAVPAPVARRLEDEIGDDRIMDSDDEGDDVVMPSNVVFATPAPLTVVPETEAAFIRGSVVPESPDSSTFCVPETAPETEFVIPETEEGAAMSSDGPVLPGRGASAGRDSGVSESDAESDVLQPSSIAISISSRAKRRRCSFPENAVRPSPARVTSDEVREGFALSDRLRKLRHPDDEGMQKTVFPLRRPGSAFRQAPEDSARFSKVLVEKGAQRLTVSMDTQSYSDVLQEQLLQLENLATVPPAEKVGRPVKQAGEYRLVCKHAADFPCSCYKENNSPSEDKNNAGHFQHGQNAPPEGPVFVPFGTIVMTGDDESLVALKNSLELRMGPSPAQSAAEPARTQSYLDKDSKPCSSRANAQPPSSVEEPAHPLAPVAKAHNSCTPAVSAETAANVEAGKECTIECPALDSAVHPLESDQQLSRFTLKVGVVPSAARPLQAGVPSSEIAESEFPAQAKAHLRSGASPHVGVNGIGSSSMALPVAGMFTTGSGKALSRSRGTLGLTVIDALEQTGTPFTNGSEKALPAALIAEGLDSLSPSPLAVPRQAAEIFTTGPGKTLPADPPPSDVDMVVLARPVGAPSSIKAVFTTGSGKVLAPMTVRQNPAGAPPMPVLFSTGSGKALPPVSRFPVAGDAPMPAGLFTTGSGKSLPPISAKGSSSRAPSTGPMFTTGHGKPLATPARPARPEPCGGEVTPRHQQRGLFLQSSRNGGSSGTSSEGRTMPTVDMASFPKKFGGFGTGSGQPLYRQDGRKKLSLRDDILGSGRADPAGMRPPRPSPGPNTKRALAMGPVTPGSAIRTPLSNTSNLSKRRSPYPSTPIGRKRPFPGQSLAASGRSGASTMNSKQFKAPRRVQPTPKRRSTHHKPICLLSQYPPLLSVSGALIDSKLRNPRSRVPLVPSRQETLSEMPMSLFWLRDLAHGEDGVAGCLKYSFPRRWKGDMSFFPVQLLNVLKSREAASGNLIGNARFFGIDECLEWIRTMFKSEEGKSATCIGSAAWTRMAYSLAVWKCARLAIMEQMNRERADEVSASLPFFSAAHVVREILRRLHVEWTNEKAPPLLKMMRKDIAPGSHVVLLVTSIVIPGSGAVQLEVSDGWHIARGRLDSGLSLLVRERGRIRVGDKLHVSNAALIGAKGRAFFFGAGDELGSSDLKLSINGVRKVPVDLAPLTRLGLRKMFGLFHTKLSEVLPGGGDVPCLVVVVQRSYPVLFVEKGKDGGQCFFRQEEAESIAHEAFLEDKRRHTDGLAQAAQGSLLLADSEADGSEMREVSTCLQFQVIGFQGGGETALVEVWRPSDDLVDLVQLDGSILLLRSAKIEKVANKLCIKVDKARVILAPPSWCANLRPLPSLTPLTNAADLFSGSRRKGEEIDGVFAVVHVGDLSSCGSLRFVFAIDALECMHVVGLQLRDDLARNVPRSFSRLVARRRSSRHNKKSFADPKVPDGGIPIFAVRDGELGELDKNSGIAPIIVSRKTEIVSGHALGLFSTLGRVARGQSGTRRQAECAVMRQAAANLQKKLQGSAAAAQLDCIREAIVSLTCGEITCVRDYFSLTQET